MTSLTAILQKPITSVDEAKAWIRELIARDMMFHFEDSPEEIGNSVDGKWVDLWSAEDAAIISARRDELYTFDWAEFDCPIGYALDQMDE